MKIKLLLISLVFLFTAVSCEKVSSDIDRLHEAVKSGDIESFKNLIGSVKYQINKALLVKIINTQDKDGKTALHHVAYSEQLEIAKLLIENGADINFTNKNIFSPLHQAAWYGHVEIAVFFLGSGAKINNKDSQGRTPLDIAYDNSHKELANTLKLAGAKRSSEL